MGETQVVRDWCGEHLIGLYADLCFRKKEEAKTNTRQKPSPTPGMDQVPGNGLGEKRLARGPRGSATWVVGKKQALGDEGSLCRR